MARAIYPHELSDPDFQWLISTFRENRPHLLVVEETNLPLVFILLDNVATESDSELSMDGDAPMVQSHDEVTEQREESSEQ